MRGMYVLVIFVSIICTVVFLMRPDYPVVMMIPIVFLGLCFLANGIREEIFEPFIGEYRASKEYKRVIDTKIFNIFRFIVKATCASLAVYGLGAVLKTPKI